MRSWLGPSPWRSNFRPQSINKALNLSHLVHALLQVAPVSENIPLGIPNKAFAILVSSVSQSQKELPIVNVHIAKFSWLKLHRPHRPISCFPFVSSSLWQLFCETLTFSICLSKSGLPTLICFILLMVSVRCKIVRGF